MSVRYFLVLLSVSIAIGITTGCSDAVIPAAIQTNDDRLDSVRTAIVHLHKQGKIYLESRNFEGALRSQRQAMSLALSMGDTLGMISTFNEMDSTFQRMGQWREALELHQQSTRLTNLLYTERGSKPDDLIATYMDAMTVRDEITSMLGQARTHIEQNNIALARHIVDSARVKARKLDLYPQLSDCSTIEARCDEIEGKLQEAIYQLRLAKSYADSLRSARLVRLNREICTDFLHYKGQHVEMLSRRVLDQEQQLQKVATYMIIILVLLGSITVVWVLIRCRNLINRMREEKVNTAPSAVRPADLKFMEQLAVLVQKQMVNGELSVEAIADRMSVSKKEMNLRVKKVTGLTASNYILKLRMDKAEELLTGSDISIGDISIQCGFDDMSYFSRVFRMQYGVTPSQFRNNIKAGEQLV